MLPYEGSAVVVNEDENIQFYNTSFDFIMRDLLPYDGKKEIDLDTKIEYYYEKDKRESIDNVDIKTNFNKKFKAN